MISTIILIGSFILAPIITFIVGKYVGNSKAKAIVAVVQELVSAFSDAKITPEEIQAIIKRVQAAVVEFTASRDGKVTTASVETIVKTKTLINGK